MFQMREVRSPRAVAGHRAPRKHTISLPKKIGRLHPPPFYHREFALSELGLTL